MTAADLDLNPHTLVTFLGKPAAEATRADIVAFARARGITMLNLRYVGGDGRLKTLNFVINSRAHLEDVLTFGERVDGSSLFPHVPAEASDVYVVPRYRSAYINPFAQQPTLDLQCDYYDATGHPLAGSPGHVLDSAQRALQEQTGATLEALGELEYYLFDDLERRYPVVEQRGYHESEPFAKGEQIRREALSLLSAMGARIKYGHSEVGNIVHDQRQMVQGEIEFLPVDARDAADQLVLAKWVLREVSYRHGLEVSYAPKIIVGHAGSGLHVHTRLVRDGVNLFAADADAPLDAPLPEAARRVIAGYLRCARSLTAFGNTVPTSYLRLVPHQEAPTSVCWGERNRSALVRVPLGWRGVGSGLQRSSNPAEPGPVVRPQVDPQTIELRSGDGSANVHLLLAGMAVAARVGLTAPDALERAERLHVAGPLAAAGDLEQLPASCAESARALDADRDLYEKGGVFPPGLIDQTIADLHAHGDDHLSERLFGDAHALAALVQRHLHCG